MISFLNIAALNKPYETAFQEKFNQALQKGWWILGEEVQYFEKHWAIYCQTAHAIGVGNGLDALTILLKAAQICGKLQPNDAVAVPANTYIATILSIIQAGLKPILVEPNEKSFLVTEMELEKLEHAEIKAFVAVHLYGRNAISNKVAAFCNQKNWLLFEDAAQAHGALNEMGLRVGNLSLGAAFSFYPGKNLGALGDAGAITTSDAGIAEVCKALRNYGSHQKYHNIYEGFNSRLDEIQAAFLNVKLPYLDAENQKRREMAAFYVQHISNPFITLPELCDTNHVWHLFVIKTDFRDALQTYLTENGVQTLIHYPIPPHKQPALASYHFGAFPITEKIHQQVLSLPIGSHLSDSDLHKVVQIINAFKP
jgi:dTDP-4-amino-4,6-dideoxygalactose transaminase